jgi:6-pyruvoyltetrahydropterin/6-carboxytetrahydropterin synthase
MNITIMRQVKFCAGHRLLGHEGRCANLHGHNYIAQIFVTSSETDQLGRVVDFAVINRLFKGWIDEHWDHGVLLWDEDQEAIKALTRMEKRRVFCLPYNPTAENIARYLLTEVAPMLISRIDGYDVHVSKVVVWETEDSAAEAAIEIASDGRIVVNSRANAVS